MAKKNWHVSVYIVLLGQMLSKVGLKSIISVHWGLGTEKKRNVIWLTINDTHGDVSTPQVEASHMSLPADCWKMVVTGLLPLVMTYFS